MEMLQDLDRVLETAGAIMSQSEFHKRAQNNEIICLIYQ